MTSSQRAALLVCVAIAPLAAACSSGACNDARNECVDATTLGTCAGSVDAIGQSRRWSQAACPADNPSCVTRQTTAGLSPYDAVHRALCAAGPSPDPACDGRGPGLFCANNATFSCADGFLVHAADCNPDACFETDAGTPSCATCLPKSVAVRDESCASGASRVCDGNVVDECVCGYRGRTVTRCDPGQPCVSTGSGTSSNAFCAVSSQPDSRCTAQTEFDLFCTSDELVQCHLGYDVHFRSCPAGCDPATTSCK